MAAADGERRRRLDAALPGTERALPSAGTSRARSETVARYGAGAVPAVHARRLAGRLRRARAATTTRSSARSAWPARRAASPAPASRAAARSRPSAAPAIRCRRCAARAGPSSPRTPRAGSAGIRSRRPRRSTRVPYNGNPECTYCGFCSGNGCYRDAKGSTDATVIRRAEATGLLRIETGARVTRIESGDDGLVTGATYVQDGRERFCPARVVLLATFTYENTRLLLLSRSPAHPQRPRERERPGRPHYMAHVTPFAFGRFPGAASISSTASGRRRPASTTGTPTTSTTPGSASSAAGCSPPRTSTSRSRSPASRCRRASRASARAGRRGSPPTRSRSAALSAQMECLPYEGNRLDLDPRARDPLRRFRSCA